MDLRSRTTNDHGSGSGGEILDEADKRLLVKKIWCHGQVVAPFQGVLCGYWTIIDHEQMTVIQIIVLWLVALALPIWSVVSWKAMHGKSITAWKIICYFGIFVEVLHLMVIDMTVRKGLRQETLILFIFIFSLLHLVETAAYLSITTIFRRSFVNDQGEQLTLL